MLIDEIKCTGITPAWVNNNLCISVLNHETVVRKDGEVWKLESQFGTAQGERLDDAINLIKEIHKIINTKISYSIVTLKRASGIHFELGLDAIGRPSLLADTHFELSMPITRRSYHLTSAYGQTSLHRKLDDAWREMDAILRTKVANLRKEATFIESSIKRPLA